MAGTTQHPAPVHQEQHDPYGHGHSVAAWVAVSVIMLGAAVACVGVGIGWNALWVSILGGVIVLLGPILGKILGALGFGSNNRSAR